MSELELERFKICLEELTEIHDVLGLRDRSVLKNKAVDFLRSD